MQRILINKALIGLVTWLMLTAAHAAEPLWTITPASGNNPTQTIPDNGTVTLQYIVQNQSVKSKNLRILPTPGITQTSSCVLAPKGQIGSTCTLTLNINGSELPSEGIHGGPVLCQTNVDGNPNSNQCYQPSAANSLNLSIGLPTATITATPLTLLFAQNSTGIVTVTNSLSSPVAADNVTANIPGGSTLIVQSTTCGVSLAIGASCTITFASSSLEEPITVPIAGDNTNTVNVDVTVTNRPQISITGPAQQSRIIFAPGAAFLLLQITNDISSLINANGITVTNKAACPNLTYNDTDCASVAPGDTCTLQLASSTPYVPCTITVGGSNTANSPQTLIAFHYLGGLVFQESAGSGKIVIDAVQEFNSPWTVSNTDIAGATSLTDGVANTNAIIADPACTLNNCAALQCRSLNAVWYLPARDELSAIHNALCSNNATPCDFGGFVGPFYWSSSQINTTTAWIAAFPTGLTGSGSKTVADAVRCVRLFP